MSIFHPTIDYRRITDIPVELLQKWGVALLILDVDNTLTTHGNPNLAPAVVWWLAEMKEAGLSLVILSNNSEERVRPFAAQIGLDYTASAGKPLAKGFRETAERYRTPKERIAVVGDQIFTDVLGGNLYGVRTILVEPIEMEEHWGFKLKRGLEKGILRRYRNRKGRTR